MRVICVFREGEDYSRGAADYVEDFYRRTGRRIEVLNPDENVNFCESHDVVEYPTILVLDDRGGVVMSWRGREMPLVDEVLYYLI